MGITMSMVMGIIMSMVMGIIIITTIIISIVGVGVTRGIMRRMIIKWRWLTGFEGSKIYDRQFDALCTPSCPVWD
jgi:hypothetical protein